MQVAEIKMNPRGKSFFIPVNDFTSDAKPVNQQEDEDMESGSDEAARFEHYMRSGEESLLREYEKQF